MTDENAKPQDHHADGWKRSEMMNGIGSKQSRQDAGIGIEDHARALPPAGPVHGTALFALVIDDQESVCGLMAAELAKLGVECATYPTANPAIASIDDRWPDIIFLDIALDQSDAIDVIKGLSEKNYDGIVQLMSGGRPPLLEAIQRIGVRYGLSLRAPLQKPLQGERIREAIAAIRQMDQAPLRSPA